MNSLSSNALGERIAALIAAQGPISVAHYMTLALHDAAGGYYATRQPFGAAGDFTTAPEISQMFGEMLGLWCVQVWHDQGQPKRKRLVELGPGRGTMMADALRAAKVAPEFLVGLEVVLVESSPALQKAQAEKLKDCGAEIRWAAHFDDTMADRALFLLANEFFDAMPVRQYVKTERGWCERMVVVKDGELEFALAPMPTPHAAIAASRAGAPDGGVYESAPASTALTEAIARVIASNGGGALLVDYGYGENPDGYGETLQAVGGHQFADVLVDPGENDLSAHVDFAAIAEAARHGGAAVYGPRAQGEFLADLGITGRAEQLMKTNPAAAQNLFAAVERLIGPGQMGTLFKAMALLPPSAAKPPGF
jgi:NADH dehydrogenase [ubiquinone] 1 alpha subcomplex assembly factor 7